VDHVNEYGDNLNSSITKEEDQKNILIIGGIKVFLPNTQVETIAHDESAAEEERQPTMTSMMKEQGPESSQGEQEEDSIVEILTQWDIELRMLEDWLNNP